MKLKILHLSDLHVNVSDEPYLRRLAIALSNDVKRCLPLDLVVISGDLINKGECAENEFPLVEELFLAPLRAATGLAKDDFFFVPGNHEVDRTKTSKAFELGFPQDISDEPTFRHFVAKANDANPNFTPLLPKLSSYFEFLKSQGNKHCIYSSYFYNVYSLSKQGLTLGIVAANSTWRSSQYITDNNNLIIGDHVLAEASVKIPKADIRICIAHHSTDMLVDWDRKPVRSRLAKHFNLFLNGHVHDSDSVSARQLLGALFISTAGCLKPLELLSSYTLLTVDLEQDTITCDFRKWYSEREEFDQDTSKAPGGSKTFKGIKADSPASVTGLQAALVRSHQLMEKPESEIVCPLEGIEDVDLKDVFVEPILTNRSSFDRSKDGKTTLDLKTLLTSSKNLLFAGRPEFGKTTLLRYSRDFFLANEQLFETVVPVYIQFSDIPKTSPKALIKQIRNSLPDVNELQVQTLAEEGGFILLVDDYYDRQEEDYERKGAALRAFFKLYPKCRYILAVTEYLAQPLQLELLTIGTDFAADTVYIGSLNTARIRQILQKWRVKQSFEVDGILTQMLYYFQHFQIPVTPLSVTLFLGVLFRRKKERNIRNEAYLIENYLETILEKLSTKDHGNELDFRDKEDFLAHIAWKMLDKDNGVLTVNEFEQAKLNYFENLDEDIPPHALFDTFFNKGLLVLEDGLVFFKRHFWFHFFVAKALARDPEYEKHFLKRPDVLRHSKALVYKAGLARNDLQLLEWADREAMAESRTLIDKYNTLELKDAGANEPFEKISKQIEQDIREKNKDEEVDKRRDTIFLAYDDDKGNELPNAISRFEDLLTLQSDLIRNTTQIEVSAKRRYIANNVSCYIAMMWAGLEAFRNMVQNFTEEDLFKLFFKGKKDATMTQKMRYVIEHASRIVNQVVPLSVLLYMVDHLGNPKLGKSYLQLAKEAKSPTRGLFFTLLLFSQSPRNGVKEIRKLVTPVSSSTEDFIISGFLRAFCHENKVESDLVEPIVDIIDNVRTKYAKRVQNDVPFLKDTFRSSIRKELREAKEHDR